MGTDKARLLLGGERMLDRQIRLLCAVCRRVAVIGPAARLTGTEVRVYEDEISGKGPLGGIYTGLRRARTEFCLFLGCDLPLMEERFLRYLCQQALETRAQATVPPAWAGSRYPLCFVLRRGVLARASSCLASGQNQVWRVFSRTSRRTISKAELARAGFSPRVFSNLNTPEEYERIRRRWAQ